jgi:hypothetical protein
MSKEQPQSAEIVDLATERAMRIRRQPVPNDPDGDPRFVLIDVDGTESEITQDEVIWLSRRPRPSSSSIFAATRCT